jgi:hypothetical protein
MTGSGGSSPSRKRFHGGWRYAVYVFGDFLSLPIFCAGLLTLASSHQGTEPKCHAMIPGIQSLWHYQGGGPQDSATEVAHDGGSQLLS